ncbi:MAG: SUMF1/EgtB/PvdO family nonheme iron enzyme [Candidatus Nanohalobium sp.]
MRSFFVAVIAIGVLSGALFGLAQISDQNLLTGNFYKMGNTSDLEKEYNSIDWNKTSEKDEYAGSVYSDSFDNLNITEISIDNKTVNVSSEEALRLSNLEKSSINITFSESILGITGKNISLNKSSDLELRLRGNISLEIKSRNKTYSKYIRTRIPDRTSSENQTTRTETRKETQNESTEYKGENETTSMVLNLTNNLSRNITSPNSLKLVNNQNHTVKLVSNNSEIINKTEAKIRGNHSLVLNISNGRNIRIRAENKTRYDISYIESYNRSNKTKSYNNTTVESRDTENTTERTGSSDQNATEMNEIQGNRSNTSTSPGKKDNSTENRTLKAEHPERGGKWVEISSERIEDFYIFKYEASRKDANSTSEGESNIPYSQQGVEPWNDISQEEASKACNRLGENYSLPTNKQWQAATGAAPGTSETFVNGNTDDGASYRSQQQSCRISEKADWNEKYCLTGTGPEEWETTTNMEDMKGNLWEWVSNTVNISSSKFPSDRSGWINSWNKKKAVPRDLSNKKASGIQNAYYYSASEGEFAIRRGGAWPSGEKAGLFSMLIDRKKTDSRASIGFRCVYEN